MQPRLAYATLAPEAYKRMLHLNAYLKHCSLEASLLELVKLRASQINHCAFCIDMHWKDARAAGEDEARLYLLNAWHESPGYTERERAALAWTEAVTLLSEDQVSDDLYAQVREHFSDVEIVDLTFAVLVINGWNRLSVSFRSQPGVYQPHRATE
ncbi:MAG TPA: carboxymuconolactone decarboxylase family protein [Herpetosiphonaceae bacterium]